MEESELRVQMSVHLHSPADAAASHMLQMPEIYRRWESEHDRLMRAVSSETRLVGQVAALRSTTFGLVHKRALFEYLRDRQLTGEKRKRLLALFYGCRDYTNAILMEHGTFMRCSTSYVCTHHLGQHLLDDAAFEEPMHLYEEWYTDYFRAYCDSELAETELEKEAVVTLDALKPLLKHRLAEAREAILAMPKAPESEWREVKIRKATGETARMKSIFGEQ
jgi:hypothetical protein